MSSRNDTRHNTDADTDDTDIHADAGHRLKVTVVYDDENEDETANADVEGATGTADGATAAPPNTLPADAASAKSGTASNGAGPVKEAATVQNGEEPVSAGSHPAPSAAASSLRGTSEKTTDADDTDGDTYDEDLDSLPEEADILLKSYPAFSFSHVTFTDRRTGRNLIDNAQWSFESGNLYAVTGADDAQRRAFLAAAGGFSHPDSGQVMVKSASLATLEINDIRGHRIGLVTQRHSVRSDLDALENLEYTMRASGRTFLSPIPEIANSLLHVVGFDQAATGVPVHAMSEVNRRRLAIARSIACDAGVIVIDAPTEGLDAEDAGSIAALLQHLAHAKDPKRCVIALTDAKPLTVVADDVIEFND